jgi:hypothetical protein
MPVLALAICRPGAAITGHVATAIDPAFADARARHIPHRYRRHQICGMRRSV